MKTVVYQGYAFQVPASWPVYRLDQHPQTCVRYDVHAVYLGAPGPNMRCAAGLVGRTQTVSFIPGTASAGPGTGLPGQSAGKRAQGSGTDLQRLPAVHSMVTQDAVRHQLSVALGTAALAATVVGTYGTDPAVVEQVLSTLRQAPAGALQSAQTRSAPVQPGQIGQDGLNPGTSRRAELSSEGTTAAPQSATATKPPSTSWPGVPAQWPVQVIQPPQPPVQPKPPQPLHPVGGFDTCTAPSVNTMHAWRSVYAAVGVYIGGANAACAAGNLSAGWVKAVTSSGWGLLPTYVGPQASCWSGTGIKIAAGNAAEEGKAAAADAVHEARSFGLKAGSPIYYDMEAYAGGTSCSAAVLAFLSAWDRQVAAAGYVTGVYSSQNSGITDMQAASDGRVIGFTPPDALWIALWDNKPSLNDGNLSWPLSARTKQYAGNVNVTIGGTTLNIDKDIVGGPLAH